jgi:hypothetical protein
MAEQINIAELLTHPSNVSRLEHIRHNETHATTSALNRFKRMTTEAPPITVSASGLVLDGMHRLAVAMDAGRVTIAANRKT